MSDVRMDLDSLVESAWRKFREALADAMEEMDEGNCLEIMTNPGAEVEDGESTYVRVLRFYDSIQVKLASNHRLAAKHKLTKPGRSHLYELGFAGPTKATPHYWATFAARLVDQAASVTVAALRVAFGFPHPAFLRSEDFAWEVGSRLPTAGAVPKPPAAVHPLDKEHLDLLIDEALARMPGHASERDSDGDIPFRSGSVVVFVRRLELVPVIQLVAALVVKIRDVAAAVREVDVLNREIEGVKFSLHGDTVFASADLVAWPFAAEHLQRLVARMCGVVSRHDKALAYRVGGRVFLDPSPTVVDDDGPGADEAIHPVMQCMLQLDADKPGSVRPKVAAKLCGYDSQLLLDLIRWNEEQECAWRAARDEAYATDRDEAEVCEIERAHAHQTVRVLRKALRRVLLG